MEGMILEENQLNITMKKRNHWQGMIAAKETSCLLLITKWFQLQYIINHSISCFKINWFDSQWNKLWISFFIICSFQDQLNLISYSETNSIFFAWFPRESFFFLFLKLIDLIPHKPGFDYHSTSIALLMTDFTFDS